MNEKRSFARLYGPPLLVITFVLPFLAYYVSLTHRQAAHFDYRAFRILESASTHLQREIDGVQSAMSAADRVGRQVRNRGASPTCPEGDLDCRHDWAPPGSGPPPGPVAEIRAYLREYVKVASDIRYTPRQDAAAGPPTPAQFRLTLCCKDETGPLQLRAALAHQGTDHEHISVSIPPASLEGRLLPGDASEFFDSMLVALADGSVIFRSSKSPYQAVQVDALFSNLLEAAKEESDPPAAKPGATGLASLQSRAGASSRTEVNAFGDRFIVYLQPTPVRLKWHGGAAGSEKAAIFVGIVRKSRYDTEANAVPPANLALLVLSLVICAAISWPLLKLFTMSPKERLRRSSLIGLFIATMAAFVLLILLYLEFGFLLWFYDRTDSQIQAIATRMGLNMHTEVTKILQSIDEQEKWLHEAGIEPNLETLERLNQPPLVMAPAYPFFRHSIFALYRPDAVDATGFVQQYKLSADRIPTPLIATRFSQFPALADLHRDRTLKLPAGRPFSLQTTASSNTGEFLTLFFTHPENPIPMPKPAPGARQVMMLTTPLLSLKDAVLPFGFGYAVLNAQGIVQFHTDSSLNLRENFLSECDNPEQLTSLMRLKAATHLDLRYHGRDRRAFLAPLSRDLPGLPWTVVVYRDVSYVRSVAMQAGLLFMIGLATAAGLVALAWMVKQLLGMIWPVSAFRLSHYRIWPIERRKPQYLRLAVCLLSGVVVLFLSTLPFFGDASSLSLLAGCATAATALLLCAARPVRLWLDGKLRPLTKRLSLALVFTLFWASLLLLLHVSGALILFQTALTAVQHDQEVASHGTLLEQLRQRADAARTQERNRGFFKGEYAPKRIETNLDVYDPRAYTDSWTGLVEKKLGSIFDQPLRVLNRHLLPPVGERTLSSLVSAAGEANSMGEDWRKAAAIRPVGKPGEHGEHGELLGSWPVVPWREKLTFWWVSYLLLGLVLSFFLFIWLYSVLRRLYAQEFDDPDPLRARSAATLIDLPPRLLVLCHPRSGTSELARQRFPAQVIDIPLDLAGEPDALSQHRERLLARFTSAERVVLDNVEWQFNNPALRRETLRLLEGLVYANKPSVLIFSSVDPVQQIEAQLADQPSPALREELDRWIRVMGGFERALFEAYDTLQPEWQKLRPILASWGMRPNDLKECRRIFWREFSGTIYLHQQAQHLQSRLEHAATRCRSAHDFERMMVSYARELADDYYRMLWITMSADERLALYQLAIDGWVNPLNKTAVCQLIRRRLVRNGHGTRAYEMLNESFRQFVLEAQDPEEVRRWREDEQSSTWRSVRLSLVTALVLVALWLLYVRQDLFDRVFSYAGAVAGGSAALLRVSWQAVQQIIQKPKSEAKP